MKTYFTLLLLITALYSNGQDTSYFDIGNIPAARKQGSLYYEVVNKNPSDTNRVGVKTIYTSTGKPRNETNYSNYTKKIRDGKSKEWYPDGTIHTDIDYKNGQISGQLLTYWDNGKPKRIDQYSNGKMVSGKCMASSGADTTYYNYEIYPQYPGGNKKMVEFLSKQIKYPAKSRKANIQGIVYTGFNVNSDSTISDIAIVKGVAPDLDNEAMRVIKLMPKWAPAKQDGFPVRSYYQLPINFSLQPQTKTAPPKTTTPAKTPAPAQAKPAPVKK